MDKQKRNWITWAVLALSAALAALMLGSSLTRTAHITLPPSNPARDPAAGDAGPSAALTVVEVTPETVQSAIASLARPERYSRTVTLQYLWDGGGGTLELHTAVHVPWTRVDRNLPDGSVRSSLTDGESTYIWYGPDQEVPAVPAGEFSADAEQSIPTYEDILDLPAEDIALADYRPLEDLTCVYVETAADQAGYATRYWVSVESGLLVQAERLLGEAVVYRMTALTLDQAEPEASRFTLPDGTVLLEE